MFFRLLPRFAVCRRGLPGGWLAVAACAGWLTWGLIAHGQTPPGGAVPTPSTILSAPLTLAQVAQNPAYWPKEIAVLSPVAVPIVYQGRVAGQTIVPAGARLRMFRVQAAQVEVEYEGTRQWIAAGATDLLAGATRLRDAALAARAVAADRPTPHILPTPGPPGPATGYEARAREVADEIQRDFWNPQTGIYAEKLGEKGPGAAWSCGVMFSALAAAARHDPDHYRPVLKKSVDAFDTYWDRKQPLGGYEPFPTDGDGHDKYYDDNEWLVIAFLEAREVTGQPEYLRRAAQTMKFVLSGWDDTFLGGGIWWHEKREQKVRAKNTCANAPAAVACLGLARVSPPTEARGQLADARRIVDWTVANLQLPNSLFADTKDIAGDGMNRVSLTYNSALMLRAFLGLYRVTNNPQFLQRAQRIAVAAGALVNEKTGVFYDHKKWAHLMVEADLALYRTTGEPYLLQRARRQADAYYDQWKADGPVDLITAASISRTLWLVADLDTVAGRNFWKKMDAPTSFP